MELLFLILFPQQFIQGVRGKVCTIRPAGRAKRIYKYRLKKSRVAQRFKHRTEKAAFQGDNAVYTIFKMPKKSVAFLCFNGKDARGMVN